MGSYKKMKKIILIDIDNTLNEFSKFFFSTAKDLGYELKRTRYEDYDLGSGIKIDNPLSVLEKIFNAKGFWENIPVKINAQKVVKRLNKDFSVFIVSIASGERGLIYNCKKEKTTWIKNNFPFINPLHILFKADKWNINSNFLIDDKPEILLETMKKGRSKVIKFNYKYNESIEANYSVNSWLEVEKIFYDNRGNRKEALR